MDFINDLLFLVDGTRETDTVKYLLGILNNLVDTVGEKYLPVTYLLGILVGTLLYFFGYRLHMFIIAIIGFLLGVIISSVFFASNDFAILLIVASGFIGGFLAKLFYKISIFILGFLLGGFIFLNITNGNVAVSFIMAILVGIMALMLSKFILIITTTLIGLWFITIGILFFIGKFLTLQDILNIIDSCKIGYCNSYPLLFLFVALFLFGVIFQYKFNNNLKLREYKENDNKKL